MPDNPHPRWRQERCEHCADGKPLVSGKHWMVLSQHWEYCSAPALEAYIAELEQDRARLDWLTPHITGKEYRRIGITYASFSLSRIRQAIDSAIAAQEPRKGHGWITGTADMDALNEQAAQEREK